MGVAIQWPEAIRDIVVIVCAAVVEVAMLRWP